MFHLEDTTCRQKILWHNLLWQKCLKWWRKTKMKNPNNCHEKVPAGHGRLAIKGNQQAINTEKKRLRSKKCGFFDYECGKECKCRGRWRWWGEKIGELFCYTHILHTLAIYLYFLLYFLDGSFLYISVFLDKCAICWND